MHKGVLRYLLLNDRQDNLRRADRGVDAQLAENELVPGIVDASNGAGDVETTLGNLRDDEIVLVVAGDRRDNICALGSRLLECGHFGAVSNDDRGAQIPSDAISLRPISLND